MEIGFPIILPLLYEVLNKEHLVFNGVLTEEMTSGYKETFGVSRPILSKEMIL